MPRKSSFDYFDAFLRIANFADDEAKRILKIFNDFDPETINNRLTEMHAIEHFADLVTHQIYSNVVADFITPIDREDILSLADELDDVVDYIEDVMQRIYMFNIRTIIPPAIEMMEITAASTTALKQAIQEFPNFKRSKNVLKYLVDVNTYEEQADQLYIKTLHDLFSSEEDGRLLLAWTKTFDRLERCTDAAEHAADVMTSIIAKNS
jgi:predicted phosphate transport protein (TIGR00153 family)